MLSLQAAVQAGGAVLFGDTDDADLYRYLPSHVRLAAAPAGDSSFVLWKYRFIDESGAAGGGFAAVEVELTAPDEDRLRTAVATATGRSDAQVAPVLFRSGEVRALTMQENPDGIVHSVLGSSAAPLVYPHHTVFGLVLSPAGAALFEQAAAAGAVPLGLVYELRFLVVTPALHARVTMDYDRIYEHFGASLGFTYYYVSARLDAELAWLVEHDLIHVDVTQYVDDTDQTRQRELVMDLVRARLAADFFRSGLPAQGDDPGLGGVLGQLIGRQTGGNLTSDSALFVLKARFELTSELKRFELRYDGRTAVELTHVASGFLGTMAADAGPDGAGLKPVVHAIDATDPFFTVLDVAVVVSVGFTDVPDLREVVVSLMHGDHRASYVATPAASGPFRFTAPLPDRRDDAYTVEVAYHFDPASTAGPPLMTGPVRTTRDRALVVDTGAAFRVDRVRLSLAPQAAELVHGMAVRLRVPAADGTDDLAHDVVTLDPAHPEAVWYRRLPLESAPRPVRARADWIDAHGVSHEGEEVEVVGGDFVAVGPVRDELPVRILPTVDWTTVRQLYVEIRHVDGDLVQHQELVFSADAGPGGRQITLALVDPDNRGYQWRKVVVRVDGTSSSTEWAEADAMLLAVDDAPPSEATVRVTWLGDRAGALAMRADFYRAPGAGRADEQIASALLLPAEPDTVVRLPLDPDGRLHYRYEVRRIDDAGETLVRTGEDSTRLLVVRTR